MRQTTLLFLLLAGILSVALFSIKYQVQDMEEELVRLNRAIINERQSIHVLKAEWSHLNNPERLAILARRYLGMKPLDPARMINFQGFERLDIGPRIDDKETADLAHATSFEAERGQP